MDLGSALIGLIIIVLIVVPFIIMNLSMKRKNKQMLNYLTNIATKQKCAISQYDLCGDFIIGIDELKNVLFYY